MAVRPIDGTWSKFVWNLGEKSESLARKFREGKACFIDLRLAVDAQPTLIQPNEPLTLEKLENMEDTTPVWWDQINSWVLVYKGNLTTWSGKHLYAKGCNGKFYRRPPEEVLKDG